MKKRTKTILNAPLALLVAFFFFFCGLINVLWPKYMLESCFLSKVCDCRDSNFLILSTGKLLAEICE